MKGHTRPKSVGVPPPVWRLLDPTGTAALLTVSNTWAHRQVFEPMLKVGEALSPFILDAASSVYQDLHGRTAPADTAALLLGIPAATAVLATLQYEMARRKTKVLLVDLRNNGGGHSMLVNIVLYHLFGRRSWSVFGEMRTVTRRETAPADAAFPARKGDYLFPVDTTPAPDVAGSEAFWARITTTFARELSSGHHDGAYRPPRLCFLVSPSTFSGGFWLASALHRLGATLVGVPSGQAPAAFSNSQHIRLPASGLVLSVSSRHLTVVDSPAADQLPVDVPLTVAAYRRLGRAPDPLLALARAHPSCATD